jgi:hypothetical protein
MTTKIDLMQVLAWGPATRVKTKFGERNLRKADATDNFRALYKTNKEALKSAGISWEIKDGQFTGKVCWWAPITAADIAAEKKADELSRATDADIVIPAPEGLAYLGYQKAGIAFALRAFGYIK